MKHCDFDDMREESMATVIVTKLYVDKRGATMKATKLVIMIITVLLLTACSNTKALEAARTAVDVYNTAATAYNEKAEAYNEAASKVNENNAMLQSLLDETQEVINKGELPFDENTLTELKDAMSVAAEAKKSDVDPVEIIDIFSVDEKAKSKELKELEDKAIAAEEELKERSIPETPEIPDYTDVCDELQGKKTAYENSVQGMKQVTAPTDEFVMERLQRIETITKMDAVSEDHDPNGQLNKQGGYIGCVYFEDTQVDRSRLYIEDGKDNVIDVGTDGGGAVEIFRTADEAKQRDTYLGAFDGGMFASGSHYVVGTCLVRTSNELTGTQQLELTDAITNALIAVDSDTSLREMDSADTDESAQDGGLEVSEELPVLDQLDNLSSALDFMVHYGVFYDDLNGDPGEEFWNRLSAALFTNSWFGPFSEKGWETVWTNERVAEAGSIVTGYDLQCSAFPEGLDRSEAASPYLFSSEKENISITALEDNTFRITYDMVWYGTSTDTTPGKTIVTAVIKSNKESPLNAYSIISLNGEVVEKPS